MSTQRDDPSFGDPAHVGSGEPAPQRAQSTDNNRRFVLSLRVLAGLSALLSLLSLWSVESRQLAHDLQLAAESEARPGDRLALRALIFRDVDALEGASLALGPTQVRLLDERAGSDARPSARFDRELASVTLRPTGLDTLDGSLQLPAALSGDFILEARARYQDTELLCRRPLHVDPSVAPAHPHGREAGPLQHLSLGPVHALAPSAPWPLLPRVVGGACLPDELCRLLVWVGQPAALLSVRASAAVELVGPVVPSGESIGIVELTVRVRGPEAALTLEARQHGQLVAERALRLPIGLGEVGLSHRDSIVPPARLKPTYVLPPGRALVTVDTFVDGRWSDLRVVSSQARDTAPLFDLASSHFGLVRVQARADKLSADGSGGRVFYLARPGEDDSAALASSARALAGLPELAAEPTAAWAVALPSFAGDDVQRTAAFLLAPLEQLRMSVPLPVSGRPAQLAGLSHTRALFRFGVAGALVLSAFVLALSIARRGLLAADEAQSILDLARGEGENTASPERGEVAGARLRVLLLAFAVAAAFLAAALLIAAKPLWF